MGRAPCCDKSNVKRGPWSPEEDALLKTYMENHGHGGNWIALPQKAGLKRCGKSCRLRWLNYLRPDIKHGGFTNEEDTIICSLYNKLGSRWSVIASHLPGRTDNDVKNYWNTKLKKKLVAMRENRVNSLSSTDQMTIHFDPSPQPLPPLHLPVVKSEFHGPTGALLGPTRPNFSLVNAPYRHFYEDTHQNTLTSLLEGKVQAISPPISDEFSAASSSVSTTENWGSSDDVLFGDFEEFINGYGDSNAAYFSNFTSMLVYGSEAKHIL